MLLPKSPAKVLAMMASVVFVNTCAVPGTSVASLPEEYAPNVP